MDGECVQKTVAVMDQINRGGVAMLTRWTLSVRHMGVFRDSMVSFASKRRGMRCVFSLFDESDNVVSKVAVPVDGKALFMWGCGGESIIPNFLPLLPDCDSWHQAKPPETYEKIADHTRRGGSFTMLADRFIGYIDVKIEKAEIKRIKSAEIKLETTNKGEVE